MYKVEAYMIRLVQYMTMTMIKGWPQLELHVPRCDEGIL